MKSRERLIHAFVLSVVSLASISLTAPVVARDAGQETSAVQAYVARTREVSNADYRIDRQPDQDNLRIYRVTIGPDVKGITAAERVFDISVSEDTAEVVGESTVKLAD